jgi:hypothetical protein
MSRIPVIFIGLDGLGACGFGVGDRRRRISVIFLHHGLLD